MMNEIKIFENSEFGAVRTSIIDNQPYFVGKDVADILGYKNSRRAIRDHVDEEDKGVTKWVTKGGVQNVTVINESGLYSLILGSKLPSAKRFKKWVTSEVLPSIRKHGIYTIDEIIANPDLILEAATSLKKERESKKIKTFNYEG
ncbi:MAG: Bro-N domain-containing protein [Selenomonadaceae bacterium]|nr:Bro-N domain-containing protein [Selenomonadaceae bacterium]